MIFLWEDNGKEIKKVQPPNEKEGTSFSTFVVYNAVDKIKVSQCSFIFLVDV